MENLIGPAQVADVNSIEELTEVHRILFEGGVIVVEGLANLTSLSKSKVIFIALPLKVASGDRGVRIERWRLKRMRPYRRSQAEIIWKGTES